MKTIFMLVYLVTSACPAIAHSSSPQEPDVKCTYELTAAREHRGSKRVTTLLKQPWSNIRDDEFPGFEIPGEDMSFTFSVRQTIREFWVNDGQTYRLASTKVIHLSIGRIYRGTGAQEETLNIFPVESLLAGRVFLHERKIFASRLPNELVTVYASMACEEGEEASKAQQ